MNTWKMKANTGTNNKQVLDIKTRRAAELQKAHKRKSNNNNNC